MRRIGFPLPLARSRDAILTELGFEWRRPSDLATAVRKLSDFYIENPQAPTPWHTPWAQAAYLAYFHPLNYARAKAVCLEGERSGFFDGLTHFIDFGSGLGSAQQALSTSAPRITTGFCVDRSTEALRLHRRLISAAPAMPSIRWETDLKSESLPAAATRLGVFSYVYTELDRLPTWAEESEALLIIEPSTREDGRRLLDLRRHLIEIGFHIHAPCTHEAACPLFTQSAKDWCHDRIEWDAPGEDWTRLEALLPMKNRTLTFSYLLARRRSPGTFTLPIKEGLNPHHARMVGDPLPEKGKSRQLLCRGPEREFLAWFPARMVEEPHLDRGDLIETRDALEIRANEVRLKDVSSLRTVPLKTEFEK